LSRAGNSGKALPMAEDKADLSREERLAARLRENLRRRKQQGRELRSRTGEALSKEEPDG